MKPVDILIRIPLLALLLSFSTVLIAQNTDRIRPYTENSFYWQYKGEPVLLVGGTDDDNPFNVPDSLGPDGLESHLDVLQSVGGNYIRNTMSSRDGGALWPFKQLENEKYDLEQWNPAYWERFDRMLQLARERDIIVQLELFDPWDYFADADVQGGWSNQPFHPNNNINYTLEESQLRKTVSFRPSANPTDHNFFHTVPKLENNHIILQYQQAFVNKILEQSFEYPNVLYCLSNELGEPIEWSDYWAKFIHDKAEENNISVQVADMRRDNDINTGDHRYMQEHPELFTFLDISQNNGGSSWSQPEPRHWDPILQVRENIADHPRPMNNTKIYGSGESSRGGADQALQKFWRSVFAGCASVRFHRPEAGVGLSEIAQTHIKSMRMLSEKLYIYSCKPHNELLDDRESNEAYCFAEPSKQYAVYFTNGGQVILDLIQDKQYKQSWLNVGESEWIESGELVSGGAVTLEAPDEGHWVAVFIAEDYSKVDLIAPDFISYPDSRFTDYRTQVPVKIETNEHAFLRYDVSDKSFEDMQFEFQEGQGDIHHTAYVACDQGEQRTIYVHAQDIAGNATTESIQINFSVDTLQTPISWNDLRYNVSDWKTGAAPIGFGWDDITTTTHAVNTLYLRKTVMLENIEEISRILLRCNFDDGMILYLNGREIRRFNLPEGEVAYETLAEEENDPSRSNSASASGYDLVLYEGVNLIAVEVHQGPIDNSDLSFDCSARVGRTVLFNYGEDWLYYDKGNEPEIKTLGDVLSHVQSHETPKCFSLLQNYPNPFNAETRIRFHLPKQQDVTTTIYNSLGQRVFQRIENNLAAGPHTLHWCGVNAAGRSLSSGLYLIQVRTETQVNTIKSLLVR